MINTWKRSEMRFLDWFLGYILSNAIFSNIGLSMALLAPNHSPPCPSSLNHVRSRMNRKFSLKSTATDSLSHYLPMDKLEKLCSSCTKNSNLLPSRDGSDWINANSLEEISKSLNDTCLLTASTFGSFLLSSPFPMKSIIFEGGSYVLSMLTVPSGTAVQLTYTDPSTILLYKPLRGFGELSTITDKGNFKERMNGKNDMNTLNQDVFRKKGGFLREFSSTETGSGSSVFLELMFTNRKFPGSRMSDISYACLHNLSDGLVQLPNPFFYLQSRTVG